jgi:biopolymer transport protein ExbD
MSFKRIDLGNRKTPLHSLIDMAFILLMFFLVTSMITKMTEQEQKLAIPTPINETGRAQILIQFINEDDFWYLDQSANAIAKPIIDRKFQPLDDRIRDIMREFQTANRCSRSGLYEKIDNLKNEASANASSEYFVLIRCPGTLPYYRVMEVIQAVSGLPNVRFGCVEGVLGDIIHARNVDVVDEKIKGGIRRNLVIEF